MNLCEHHIDENGAGSGATGGTTSNDDTGASNPYEQEISELKIEIADLSVIVDSLSSVENDVIEVRDFYAAAGNINLVADDIILNEDSNNSPTFTAKGDAEIIVDNKSDKHLMVNNLEISNRIGGSVNIQGGAFIPDTYINEQSGTEPGIHIDHNPDSSKINYQNADVIIDGDITNLASSINISLGEGDLLQQATIEGLSINLDVSLLSSNLSS